MRVELGGRAEMSCNISATPEAVIAWKKNGQSINANPPILTTTEGNLLIAHATLQVNVEKYAIIMLKCNEIFYFLRTWATIRVKLRILWVKDIQIQLVLRFMVSTRNTFQVVSGFYIAPLTKKEEDDKN